MPQTTCAHLQHFLWVMSTNADTQPSKHWCTYVGRTHTQDYRLRHSRGRSGHPFIKLCWLMTQKLSVHQHIWRTRPSELLDFLQLETRCFSSQTIFFSFSVESHVITFCIHHVAPTRKCSICCCRDILKGLHCPNKWGRELCPQPCELDWPLFETIWWSSSIDGHMSPNRPR